MYTSSESEVRHYGHIDRGGVGIYGNPRFSGTVNFGNSEDEKNKDFERKEQLATLPRAEGAAFNSRFWDHSSKCLPDTRTELLQSIITWATDRNAPSIYWINGIAGTGKSTIARTVSHNFHLQNRLGGSFFFSRGQSDLSNANKFFTTLAVQMSQAVPALKLEICRAIERNPNIAEQGLREQWRQLILDPIGEMEKTTEIHSFSAIVIVIDALDECDNDDDIKLILQLLADAKSFEIIRLKVLITSRPEIPIQLGFNTLAGVHRDTILHKIPTEIVEHDIKVFLNHELRAVRAEYDLRSDWPGEEKIQRLCARAKGLFIYASTACRLIKDPSWDQDERLNSILKNDHIGQTPTAQLDRMYNMIVHHSIKREAQDKQRLLQEFQEIVGSIVLLFDALHITALAQLLGMKLGTVTARLRALNSVLEVPRNIDLPIRLHHPSFRDFLVDQERCMNEELWVNAKSVHGMLLKRCIVIMRLHLKQDICKPRLTGVLVLDADGTSIKECIAPELQYSCRFWVLHLQKSEIAPRDGDEIQKFLEFYFLYWLETLSLLGKLSDGVRAVRILEYLVTVR